MPGRRKPTVRFESLESRAYFAITFGNPDLYESSGTGLTYPAIGDFNNDGFPDLAITNSDTPATGVSVFLNQGNGDFIPKTDLATGQRPYQAIAGDFGSDEFDDLIVTNAQDGTFTLYHNHEGESLDPHAPIAYGAAAPSGSGATAYIAHGHLNTDGRPDIVIADGANNALVTFLGTEDDSFALGETVQLPVLDGQPGAIAVGDFNDDSNADVVTIVGTNPVVQLFISNGDGTLADPQTFPVGGGSGLLTGAGLAVGDVNDDSFLDIVVILTPATGNAGILSVLLGNNDGTFQASKETAVLDFAYSVAIADLDEDDFLDAVITSNGDFEVRKGNGDGTFGAAEFTKTPFSVDNRPAIGDFNDDGKADLAFSHFAPEFNSSHSIAVFINGEEGGGGGGGGGGDETPGLTPTVNATLPTAVVAGEKVKKAKLAVNVANTSGAPLNAPVTVNLFVSSDTTLDDTDTAVGSPVVKRLKLAAGASKAVKVKFNTLPNVPDGNYYLLAQTGAEGIQSGVAASASTVNIAAPFVDLSGTFGTPIPTTLTRGKRASLPLSILNAGNVIASGPITVSVVAAASATPDASDIVIPSNSVKLKLKPGLSKTYKLKLATPADLPAGTYFFIATIDSGSALTESNESNNTVASGSTFTVSE